VFFQARQDRRIIFVVPWLDGSLIGSTDTDYQGDPAAAATDDQDRAYLLGEARRLLPGADLTEARIITTFAGVRPLLAARGRPSARSREHPSSVGSEPVQRG
jgi:glycerol-3-phosphate dehydrogenase